MRLLPFVFLILLLFGGSQLQAQDRRFTGRLVGGVNLAQIDGDQLSGYNKLGAQAGIKVYSLLDDRWSFSLGLLYSQQGSSRNLNDSPSAALDRIQLNLVEAPVMIHFTDWKFQVGAGLSYGRLINFTVEDVFGEDVTELQDYNENLFQVAVGVSFHFSDRFGLNVRWSRQINNLQADSAAGTYIARAVGIRGLYRL